MCTSSGAGDLFDGSLLVGDGGREMWEVDLPGEGGSGRHGGKKGSTGEGQDGVGWGGVMGCGR